MIDFLRPEIGFTFVDARDIVSYWENYEKTSLFRRTAV